MVQRKVENKLGIKLESKNSIKSEKRSALRPSQYQEELKKKMKKVRSLKKVPDLDKFGKQENSKFDKPCVDQGGSVSPQKKMFPAKISNRSPNYMKPTSCSDARKERLQVSTHCQITDRKILNYSKNLRHGNRGSSLAGSALKPVRSLTKTSSFKQVRSSMKVSRVPLYPLNRSTCSSTLKDSKFPASIVLNPGGTEYEGTSVVKVCPYTYCSLNGHHHAPLPPLKCFLSARRHFLKTQKKSKEFSPYKVKNPVDTGQITVTGDSSISETDMDGLAVSALIEEDFFMEIYASPMSGLAETEDSEGRKMTTYGYDEPKLDLVQTVDMESVPKVSDELSNVTDDEIQYEAEKEEDCRKNVDGQVEESYSEISLEDNPLEQSRDFQAEKEEDCRKIVDSQVEESYSEISLEDDPLEQSRDFLVAEMDVVITFPEYYESGLEDQDLANERNCKQADQAETASDICIGTDLDEDCESIEDIQMEETIYEARDMDWEKHEAQYSDNETDNFIFSDDYSETVSLPDEPIFEPDNHAERLSEAPEDREILKGGCEDIKISTVATCNCNSEDKDAELDSRDHISERDISSDRSEVSEVCEGRQSKNQMSEVLDFDHIQIEFKSPGPFHQSSEQEIEEIDACSSTENIVYHSTLSNSSDNASEEFAEVGEEKDENPKAEKDEQLDNDGALIVQECYSLQDGQETEEGGSKPANDGLQDSSVLEDQDSDPLYNELETDHVMVTSDQSQDRAIQDTDFDDSMEMKEQSNDAGDLLDIQTCDSCQGVETDQDISEDQNPNKIQKGIEINGGQEAICYDLNKILPEESKQLEAAETCLEANNKSPSEDGKIINQPQSKTCSKLKKTTNIKRKAVIEDQNGEREFNPRALRYLEIEPDPDAEKVDLKHQMMDERKNAEEWMLDYALRQAVTKLAPARKRRVSLLVEAFESVIPPPKYETHLRHSTESFTHARPIQACS